MWINLRTLWALSLLLMTTACTHEDKIERIEGFNREAWLADQKGCLNTRKPMGEFLYEHQEQFKGIEIEALIIFLGPPEIKHYRGRDAYFYHYYLEPGKQCTDSIGTYGDQLVVEAEAMGRVRTLRLENGIY